MTRAMTMGLMPMKSESRPPWMSRVSMSRPISSAPSGYPGVPMGFRRFSMLALYGSARATRSANTAERMMARRTTPQTIVTLSSRTRSATVVQ